MPNNFCPMCQKEFKDIIKHFSLYHDIRDIEALNSQIEKIEHNVKKKAEFSKFILEINERKSKGEIDIEQWRQLRDSWIANNE